VKFQKRIKRRDSQEARKLAALARNIANVKELRWVLDDAPTGLRRMMFSALQPHLRFAADYDADQLARTP
jgi:hypothetical protein